MGSLTSGARVSTLKASSGLLPSNQCRLSSKKGPVGSWQDPRHGPLISAPCDNLGRLSLGGEVSCWERRPSGLGSGKPDWTLLTGDPQPWSPSGEVISCPAGNSHPGGSGWRARENGQEKEVEKVSGTGEDWRSDFCVLPGVERPRQEERKAARLPPGLGLVGAPSMCVR